MIKKDYLTIVIQPDWNRVGRTVSTTTTFEIPTRIFYYMAIAVALLAAFGITGVETVSKNLVLRQKSRLLETTLVHLATINRRVENMCRQERIIRTFFGLEIKGRSEANEQMGLGGGTPLTKDLQREKFSARVEIENEAADLPLHLQVSELRDNLHELSVTLSKMNKQLNGRPTIMPVKGHDLWITSSFGWRRSPFTGMRELHNGLDISGKRGLSIIATADGTVTSATRDPYFGNMVTIRHDGRFSTSYGHLQSFSIKNGQKVLRGQTIGYLGSTGLSTGYHVHYIVTDNGKDVNPYGYILNREEIAFAANLWDPTSDN